MEEGSLRCDANISLRPAGTRELGVKTELKNMNSFRFIERGIRAELARQEKMLREGGQVVQETLHFDPASERITSLRSKEEAHDYRYFPEPDLLPVAIEREMLERARAAMPELPADRAARLERDLGLSADSARQLAFRAELGDYFEAALSAGADPAPPAQALANWVVSDLVGRLGDGEGAGAGAGGDPNHSRVQAGALATLVGLVAAKRISVGAGRQVLDRLVADGGDPHADRSGRGPGGDRRRRRPRGDRRRGARRQRRCSRAREGRQRQGDRPDRGSRDARDQGPRRRRRGHTAGAPAVGDRRPPISMN